MNNLNIVKALNESFENSIKESKKLNESSIDKIKSRVKEIQDEEKDKMDVVYDTDADKEIRKYFNYEMDLSELHEKLEKIFGSKAKAAKYFADNELRIKNQMPEKLNKNPNSNHYNKRITVNNQDDKPLEETDKSEKPKRKVMKLVKEDETIVVNTPNQKADYSIVDVTELENVNDGDVQAPDVDALLTMIQESLKEKYGNDAINIHIHSSSLMENGSFALVDIKTPEILKEFEKINVNDIAVGKSLILENKSNGIYEFKVNNTSGTTRYLKRTKTPAKTILEWIETEFLSEAKAELDKKKFEERSTELKNIIDLYLEQRPQLKMNIELIKDLIQLSNDEEYKDMIQDKIYEFAAEFPASLHVKQDEDSVKFDVDDSTELKFDSIDEIVALIFGKEWVKETKLNESEKLNESYQQFNIGEIEVVYNPETQEVMYSIGADNTQDKKINLSKVPSVDTPYNTETIIKNYIEKQYGPIPQEDSDEEVPADDTIPADNTPTDEEVPVDDTASTDEDKIEDADEEPNPLEQDSNSTESNDNPEAAEDSKSETGTAKFQKIRPNQKITVEDVRDNMREGTVQADSTYIVVEEKSLTDEEFNQYTENLNKPQDFFTGVTPIDRKNYAFNVVKITNSNASYTILADPVGYNYGRYIAIVDNM